jgi:hypothetical protein
MGVAFYPRIEGVSDDWACQISGKTLAREYDRLHQLIKKQGFKELMEFYVPSEEEEQDENAQEWFNPMEGIAIIEAMLNAIRDRQNDFESYDKLKADLDDFRAILDKAAAMSKKWNLGMDY